MTTYNLKLKWKYKNTNTKGNTVNFNKDSTSVLPETPQRVYVKFRVIGEQVSMQKRPSMLITVIQRQKNKSLLASPIFTKLNDKCKAKRQGMPQEWGETYTTLRRTVCSSGKVSVSCTTVIKSQLFILKWQLLGVHHWMLNSCGINVMKTEK